MTKRCSSLPSVAQYKDKEDYLDNLSSQLDADPFYKQQLDKIMSYEKSELDPDFLGFTSTYRHLSLMIPLHFTIIDFGCNHACQAFYFAQHKKYIGIDSSIPIEYRLAAQNSEHFLQEGFEFLKNNKSDLALNNYPIFAISNYMPSENLNFLIRAVFPDLYIFYPKSKMPARN